MIEELLTLIAILLALPLVVCILMAAGILFFAYAMWVIEMFGRLVEYLMPSLRD